MGGSCAVLGHTQSVVVEITRVDLASHRPARQLPEEVASSGA